jgi:CBS domain-containing protein
MARYGGDYGRYRQGMRNYPAGMSRGYGAGYGYGPGPEDFRGGFYRGGGRPGAYGPAFSGMRSDVYATDRPEFAGEEGWYGAGSEGYPRGEPRLGYDREYGAGWGRAGNPRTGYGVDFRPGYGGFEGERGRYGGAATRPQGRGRQRGAEQVCAANIMTEDPEAVTADTTVADAARKMKELNVGIIPVVDNLEKRRLEGVITDRDIAIRVVAEGKDGKAKVSDCMTKDVESCRRSASIRDVLDVMRSEQVRRVPITDEEGCLVGIVAQADLAVDYAGFDPDREIDVEETVERISEPARPQRGRSGMRAGGR